MKSKKLLVVILLLAVATVWFLGVIDYLLNQLKPPSPPSVINKVEISADKKSILNADTKAVIFTIADTKKYLKDSGYFYNPDTFQETNTKYAGDCFIDAALSNRKDRIIFSTGCLPGDLPQAWIGVYRIVAPSICPSGAFCETMPPNSVMIKFLIAGSGRNFVWSADDKTITYEADLGLSGMTETRTIDSQTGEILEKENTVNDLEIVDEISRLNEQSTKKLARVTLETSGLVDNYTIDNELSTYDLNEDGPKSISVLKSSKVVGTFEADLDFYYIPVYVNKDEILMIASCSGIGGICRGELAKFDFGMKKKTTIATSTMDFFLTSDKKHLIYFTLDDDWDSYHMFIFNLETGKLVEQPLKLICEIGTNIKKGCYDLFLENKGEIIYLPLDYKDIEVGTTYKLNKNDGTKVEKFLPANFYKILSIFELE